MKVLVTGATGGIGKCVTEYLASQGVHVYACDIVESDFAYKNVEFIKMDVQDESSIREVFELLSSKGVTLDAIVNVAGIFMIDSFIEAPSNKLKQIFDVNLLGAIQVNKILFPLLKPAGRIIITTSDVAPLDPMPFNGIYNVTKTALDAYAQALRQELNLLSYKVITIRPGAFDTPLSRASLDKTAILAENTVLYKEQSVKFYNLVKSFMGKPSNPKKLAKTYYKALTKKRPKIIYRKHPNMLLRLLNALPKKLQCAIIKTLLKPKKG